MKSNIPVHSKTSGHPPKLGEKKVVFAVGCHVSAAGGLWHGPENALSLACETFQIFSRPPQGGNPAKITPEVGAQFKEAMKLAGVKEFVIHAPYILNFGSAKPSTFQSSINLVRLELERGSLLGADFVMFHPGSFKDLGEAKGMKQAQTGMKKILDGYKGTTKLLLEISAGSGSVIGDTFEELAELMSPIVKHPGFGGICFDTQHAFASGYDLRTESSANKVLDSFDKIVGLKWLRMSHINDSKVELGAKKDRHEHIGEGHLGKAGVANFLKALHKKRAKLSPGTFHLILETEHDKVEKDIKILKDLRDSL